MRRRFADLVSALRHIPGAAGWGRAGLELGWAIPCLLVVAHLGGLLRLQAPPDASTAVMLAATLFVAPALGEEVLFRGLLMPRTGAGWRAILLSTSLFVLWHPVQAVTIGPPWAGAFLDPWFLACVAILGLALARVYRATGSLWPSILAHWLVVLGWKAMLGGPF
jgi:predicted Abi (CAAX) family protease